ncbi:MAG: hypothetical protein KAR45_23335, partial [Desulfobacteraceae bacterium]|nr:hypothetical protein [Desulfobacteraceae bacterium]
MGWANNNIIKILLVILTMAVSGSEALSNPAKDNKGVFSGSDYSFFFSIPEDWVIDDKSGHK